MDGSHPAPLPSEDANAASTSPPPDRSTRPADPTKPWLRFEYALRFTVVVLIVGIVVAGSLSLLGPRIAQASTETEDLRLTVTYADISRAGLPTSFVIAVETRNGAPLPARIEISMATSYREIFDENGLVPEPDAITSDGITDTWTYRPTGTRRLVISFDARIQPDVHSGRSTEVTLRTPDEPGREPLTVSIHTRVWA